MNTDSVTYTTIFPPNSLVTGIRRDVGPDGRVLITAGRVSVEDAPVHALIYIGPLTPMDDAGYRTLLPVFPGQTVTSSTFYGPNTALFNPELGAGNLRAVGSYSSQADGGEQHGMMYEGDPDGTGTWTQIDMPDDLAGGSVGNTILHSTMGEIVVGNYDMSGKVLSSVNAFLYNTTTGAYTALNIGAMTTAYGVWQNGGSGSSSYTIAGGCKHDGGLNKGFLLDYDAATCAITNLTFYSFDNVPGFLTHFEAISGIPGGYSMAATSKSGASFATIVRNADGSFGAARWVPIANPASASLTTGNSVMDNNVIGIYHPAGGGIRSYLAVVSASPAT